MLTWYPKRRLDPSIIDKIIFRRQKKVKCDNIFTDQAFNEGSGDSIGSRFPCVKTDFQSCEKTKKTIISIQYDIQDKYSWLEAREEANLFKDDRKKLIQ